MPGLHDFSETLRPAFVIDEGAVHLQPGSCRQNNLRALHRRGSLPVNGGDHRDITGQSCRNLCFDSDDRLDTAACQSGLQGYGSVCRRDERRTAAVRTGKDRGKFCLGPEQGINLGSTAVTLLKMTTGLSKIPSGASSMNSISTASIDTASACARGAPFPTRSTGAPLRQA